MAYILWTFPTFIEPMILLEFDSIIRAALSFISNVSLSDKSWKQVSLPNRFSGLAFKSTQALSLLCFTSFSYASSSLVRLVLSSVPDALASDDLQRSDRDLFQLENCGRKIAMLRHWIFWETNGNGMIFCARSLSTIRL